MKSKSQILIKYLVIPFLFIAILIIMDFFSGSIQKQEKVIGSTSILNWGNFSCILVSTESNSFCYITGENLRFNNNEVVDINISPILKEVKTLTRNSPKVEECTSLNGLIGQLFLPILILITGLITIRSSKNIWIFLIITEGATLASFLVFL